MIWRFKRKSKYLFHPFKILTWDFQTNKQISLDGSSSLIFLLRKQVINQTTETLNFTQNKVLFVLLSSIVDKMEASKSQRITDHCR